MARNGVALAVGRSAMKSTSAPQGARISRKVGANHSCQHGACELKPIDLASVGLAAWACQLLLKQLFLGGRPVIPPCMVSRR